MYVERSQYSVGILILSPRQCTPVLRHWTLRIAWKNVLQKRPACWGTVMR